MPRPLLCLEPLEPRAVPAAVGALDPSFGTAGRAVTTFGGTESGHAVVVQPDGKIVVAGSTTVNNDITLSRYNPDGTPDAAFNGSGTARFTFGGIDTAAGLALQPDGKFVVVGSTDAGGSAGFAVARVLADGSGLDTTFAGDGTQVIQFDLGGANADAATGVAVQADGRIVVVGSVQAGAADYDFGVARLTAAGEPDTTFDTDGKRAVAFNRGGANDDRAAAVAVAPGGAIVVVGSAETAAGSHDFAAVRFLAADGALDPTFGVGGKATLDLGGNDLARAVAVRADGRLVLAGTSAGSVPVAAVAQLATNGAGDLGFGSGGTFTFSFAGGVDDRGTAVALDARGRIVVAGRTVAAIGGAGDVGVARVLADGSGLDAAFGTGGKARVDFGGDDVAGGAAVDRDGRVVVAGTTSQDGDIAVARLVGGVEKGTRLLVGGSPDGKGTVLAPSAAGVVPTTAVAVLSAFGTSAAVVRGAVGDVDGDGTDDSILVTGPGVPIRVAVVSGADNSTVLVAPFDPFGGDFTGGGFVAAADLDGDGRAEFVVTPDQGGGPRVSVFGRTAAGALATRANFLGIDDAAFRGGARAAAGDVNGDGRPDLVVAAGFGGGPRVAVFDGATVLATPTRLVADFFAFPGTDATTLRNGAFVAAGDVTGDGYADLVFGGGPGGGPRVFVLSGATVTNTGTDAAEAAPVANFFVAADATGRGGVRVAVADLDGDNRADVVAASGEGRTGGLRAYLGKNVTAAAEPTTAQDVSLYGGATVPGGVYVG